jgi:hypothetical protein
MKNLLTTILGDIRKNLTHTPTTSHVSPVVVEKKDLQLSSAPETKATVVPIPDPIVVQTTIPNKGVTVSLTSVFNDIKNFAEKLFASEQKVQSVLEVAVKDAPAITEAIVPLWKASIPLAAAIAVAVDDKGINIPADSAAFADAKTWLAQFEVADAAIEKAYKDYEASKTTTATTQPVIAEPAPVAAVKPA